MLHRANPYGMCLLWQHAKEGLDPSMPKDKKKDLGKKQQEKKTAALKKPAPEKLSSKDYNRELTRLQAELVKLQFWIKESKARPIV